MSAIGPPLEAKQTCGQFRPTSHSDPKLTFDMTARELEVLQQRLGSNAAIAKALLEE